MATYNFPDHIKGDTFKGTEFEVFADETPLDLSGYRIRMHIKTIPTASTVLHSFDTEDNTISMTNAAVGKFTLNPVIIDLPERTYVYDIEFEKMA